MPDEQVSFRHGVSENILALESLLIELGLQKEIVTRLILNC